MNCDGWIMYLPMLCQMDAYSNFLIKRGSDIWILGRDTFTQKSEFQLGRYELVLQMYPVDQRKKI